MRQAHRIRPLAVAALLAATMALAGCIPSIPTPPSPTQASQAPTTDAPADARLDDYLTAATADGGAAEGTSGGDAVTPGPGGSVTVTDAAVAVNGGSVEIQVSADAPFETVLVGVGPTGASSTTPTAWPGSYEIALDAPTTSTSIVVTLSQAPPSTEFSVVVAVASADGPASATDATNVTVVEVGTGDVQVSVSWNQDVDADLYVVDPEGDTIYYGSTTSSSGGELDLDSNPSCQIDGIRNENVTWPTDEAPSGTYEVRLNLYADCGIDQTSWVVTVQAVGRTYRWEGVLEAPGLGGGAEAGIVVGRFDVP
ncbi:MULTISPECIES: YfaP family protein [unclassified Agrococcus]|uniref:YfaP family protein n=1 Tax=unclassified Agrococcus TaxID=2615065 RepID=UPI00361BF488